MLEPNTDHGSGEAISVKGIVRRASETSDDSFVDSLNAVELAVNFADALKQAGWDAAKLDAARKACEEARDRHALSVRHCDRLHARLKVALMKVERK